MHLMRQKAQNHQSLTWGLNNPPQWKGWATTFMFDLFLNDIKMVAKWGQAWRIQIIWNQIVSTPKHVFCSPFYNLQAPQVTISFVHAQNIISLINPLAIMTFIASGSDFHTSSPKENKSTKYHQVCV